MTIEYKEPENLIDMVTQISARPAMFVGNCDFDRVAAFIDGFMMARKQFGVLGEWEIMRAFSLFLALKFNRPRNWDWSGIMKDNYGNDNQLWEMLPLLFQEFLDAPPRPFRVENV